MSRKVLTEHRSTVTNLDTGEAREETTDKVIQFPTEPEYVKLYLDDLTTILGIKEGPKKLVFELAKQMNYEGLITLNGAIKKRMAQRLGIKEGSFRNYLSKLVKEKIIVRVDTGLYEMNPHYFAKGKWPDIQRRREKFVMSVEYSADGERQIKTGTKPDDSDQPDMFG